VSNETLLHTPPSTVDEDELVDALHVAPPSARSLLATKVLAALLLVALGAVGGVWWSGRDSGTAAAAFPGGAAGQLPSGFPSGFPGAGAGAGTDTGSTGSSGSAGTTSSSVPVVVGTVVSVTGDVVVVKDLGGTTHEVRVTDSTRVTQSTTVTVQDLAAGTTVTVSGTKQDDGSVDATAVTGR